MTDNEIRAAWVWCQEIWPNYPLVETEAEQNIRLGVWREILGDCGFDAVRAALVDLADREFPPTLGQIRELADQSTSLLPSWIEAWQQVQSGRITHEVVEQAAGALGIGAWEIQHSERPQWLQSQFKDAYQVYANRWKRDQRIMSGLELEFHRPDELTE
jgi:hypothetical protein